MSSSFDQDVVAGLIPLHILHHAAQQPIYGLWIIEELAEHGYRLSAGTLYPLLHRLERRGLLRSASQRAGRRIRRAYNITPAGRSALRDARHKVRELFRELFESQLHRVFGRPRGSRRRPAAHAATPIALLRVQSSKHDRRRTRRPSGDSK